jgi:hypothetical protein
MQFNTPQHHVIFRAVFMTRELSDALAWHGIVLDMSFAEINGANSLRLDLAETARPQ